VICGSLCIAEQAFRKRLADYKALLERYVKGRGLDGKEGEGGRKEGGRAERM
jgi:hypothetical protein